MKLSLQLESWSAKAPFRITGREYAEFEVLVVELADGDHVGRGEARGVRYLGDHPAAMAGAVERNRGIIESGIERNQLMDLLPPGGARNALDCALWDLEAKRSGRSVWQLAGVDPVLVQSAYSIGIEQSPEAMAAKAEAATDHTLLKVKLDGRQPLKRMRAVRSARPDARIVVDANQGWRFDQLRFLAPLPLRNWVSSSLNSRCRAGRMMRWTATARPSRCASTSPASISVSSMHCRTAIGWSMSNWTNAAG